MSAVVPPVGVPPEAFAHWVKNLERAIESEVSRGCSVDTALAAVRQSQLSEFGLMPELLANRMAALSDAESGYRQRLEQVEYLARRALRSGRPAWYGGPGADAATWNALVGRLRSQGRSAGDVKLVDEESTAVLSLLDNPGQPRFATRGLVMGHVQSGKTGNIAALISKAADTPYRFFVVLSGMTDTLRNQTQARLDADVVDPSPQGRWHCWTRRNALDASGVLLNGDFSEGAVAGFAFGHQNHLAVMKKNAGILRRFLRKLRATPAVELENLPFLVIDDECDQASVNSARLETAISRINELIREILSVLPRVAYVGYTATPFANVLINPGDAGDLYPRHFIHPLRKPTAYFGAVELFGRAALDGEAEDVESGYDMIRVVPEEEVRLLRPQGRQRPFRFQIAESLAQAICYFILSTAAREHRGQELEHSSMLVHTSVLNSVHQETAVAIRSWLEGTVASLEASSPLLIQTMERLWNEESHRVTSASFGHDGIAFEAIKPRLAAVARAIEIKVENWTSTDRLDYDKPARRYLVVGGNVLARGLTLDGLIVSFFMRTASQYDTLMQMGRWFGYRSGFEDLPRIWLEDAVRQYFFDLATVEEEIRRDAARYAIDQLTPENFAVRIQKIPGLAITARVKMRHAEIAQVGYAGQHLQTIRFRRKDEGWLMANWEAAGRLTMAGSQPERRNGNWVAKGVPSRSITTFLRDYQLLDAGRGLVSAHMIDYIQRQRSKNSSLDLWNVVVMGIEGAPSSRLPLGQLGHVTCVSRAPLQHSGDVACIKALMSRKDIVADMEGAPSDGSWDDLKAYRERLHAPPLLLLYPVSADSMPSMRSSATREPMNAAMDVLGLALVFPGSPDTGVYVQARLEPEGAEDAVDVGEDAIPEEIVDDARS